MQHPVHEHMQRRRIYLFRHGQAIDASAESMEYPGEKPLTSLGREQAKAMGSFVKEVSFDIAVSSDYLRAKETAQLVLGERADMLETCEHFREVDTDLKVLMGGAKTADEGFKQLVDSMWIMHEKLEHELDASQIRIEKAMKFLLKKDWSTALVAAHSGFNRMFICHILGMPMKFLSVFEQDYVGMSILELDVDTDSKKLLRATLRELNVTAYNHSKSASRLLDIEQVAIETKPLMEKLFKSK